MSHPKIIFDGSCIGHQADRYLYTGITGLDYIIPEKLYRGIERMNCFILHLDELVVLQESIAEMERGLEIMNQQKIGLETILDRDQKEIPNCEEEFDKK